MATSVTELESPVEGKSETGHGNGVAMEKKVPPVESTPLEDGTTLVSARELFQENMQATVTYCSVFWSFGMCVALLGPTLLDLGCLTSSPLETMSWVFFAQALSTLVGSMFGGLLVERLQSDIILLVAISTITVTIALLPFCHALWLLGVVLAVMGIAMGTIDTTANVSLIKIYGPLVSPFLQALHFCYGIGAFISPIIAEPFLLNEDCTPLIHPNQTNTSNIVIREITEPTITEAPVTMETLREAQERTRVRFAFWIMSFIQIPIICMVLALIVKKRCCVAVATPHGGSGQTGKGSYQDIDKVTEATEIKTSSQTNEEKKCCASASSKVISLTALVALLLFIYDGLQSAYGGYVYTYSVKSVIDLSSTEGAYLTSVYWGSFALGRLVSIPISTKLSPAFMLLINIVGCFAAYAIELILRHNHIAMYLGSAMFGLFLSSIYPTALALTEQFIDVTGSVTSAIVVGAATGEMIFPVVVGRIFVIIGPVSFLVFGNIACFVSIFVYLAICLLGRTTGKRQTTPLRNLAWCRACCFASRESLLGGGEVSYYTKLGEEVKLVPITEQISPDKESVE